jgi:succinyl-CoA synthetase beta subunit
MYIHEYLAKQILEKNGVAVPKSVLVQTQDELENAYNSLNSEIVVVKAQVLSGARGKAGGIIVCKNYTEVKHACQKLLGTKLKTKQNPTGLPINSVLLEQGLTIDKELYLSISIDRSNQSIALIASRAGGGDIEEVALNTPELIIKQNIDIAHGSIDYAQIAINLGVETTKLEQILTPLYDIFIKNNCNLIEINPLIVSENELIPLDCKIEFDSNALFKHPELQKLQDKSQENTKELEAKEFGLNYISLDGEIGCMVNGAGLAMATMDLIKYHGGTPANFLDVGGGTSSDKVAKAIEIIQSEDKVKAILINIFGGIVRCDLIAEGIIQALKTSDLILPLVVRLEGTNAEDGLKLLQDSGLNIISENNLELAAKKVVEVAK